MAEDRLGVLHFANEVVRGGAEEHMLMLLRSLDRTRFRLGLVCPPELLDKFGADLPPDVDAWPLGFFSPSQLGAALEFAKILRKWRPAVLHSHMFHASMVASPLGWLCRVPSVIETTHVREHWRRGLKASYFIDRMVGRSVDAYVAVSEANGRYLAEEKRLPVRKIQVITNGCDLERFHPDSPVPQGLRDSLGIGADAPVVVVSARLEPQKGHSVLLSALPRVFAAVPEARVVFVGDGRLREELQEQAKQLRVQEQVIFAGYQSNIQDWLALSAFTVLPSFFEGLPLAAIESLAAGRAVVATAVDGTSEVVIDQSTGLTVPPGESKPLAEAIIRLLRDRAFCHELACRGRQLMVDQFSRERQVRLTEDLYVRSVSRKSANSSTVPGRLNKEAACTQRLP
jgi:glycosyltransferase involved in cell wall biosynthesis